MVRYSGLTKPGPVPSGPQKVHTFSYSKISPRLTMVLAGFYGKLSTVEVYLNGFGSFPSLLVTYWHNDRYFFKSKYTRGLGLNNRPG